MRHRNTFALQERHIHVLKPVGDEFLGYNKHNSDQFNIWRTFSPIVAKMVVPILNLDEVISFFFFLISYRNPLLQNQKFFTPAT